MESGKESGSESLKKSERRLQSPTGLVALREFGRRMRKGSEPGVGALGCWPPVPPVSPLAGRGGHQGSHALTLGQAAAEMSEWTGWGLGQAGGRCHRAPAAGCCRE